MECQACQIGIMQKPPDDHPAYLLCSNCGALELTYQPQDYQETIHTIPYVLSDDGSIKPQIIATFGG